MSGVYLLLSSRLHSLNGKPSLLLRHQTRYVHKAKWPIHGLLYWPSGLSVFSYRLITQSVWSYWRTKLYTICQFWLSKLLPGDFTPVKKEEKETRGRILGSAQKDWLKVNAYGPGYKTLWKQLCFLLCTVYCQLRDCSVLPFSLSPVPLSIRRSISKMSGNTQQTFWFYLSPH